MREFIGACAIVTMLGSAPSFAGAPEGKAIFEKSCKGCHGAEGQGNPGVAKMFKVTMQPLGSAEVQSKSDADLKKIITQGNGKMKPVTSVTGKQLDDVVAFVRTLKK